MVNTKREGRESMRILLAVLSIAASDAAMADESLRREAAALFGQIKRAAAPSPQAELGRALFWDTRL